ncbi:MAG: ankyrin repeat domain-containing protein [Terracidiphilus sp.]
MAHDVFISYSSKDRTVADAVCATLESHGVQCWIAPRDILAGEEYAASLLNGLSTSRMLVLVFSANSNRSPQTLREVERAVSKGLPILPLRIEDVAMSSAMEYFISSQHWLDALDLPLEPYLLRLCDNVKSLLARRPGDAKDAPPEPDLGAAAARAAGPSIAMPEDAEEMQKAGPEVSGRAASSKKRLWIGVGAALALVAALLGFAIFKGRSGPAPAEPDSGASVPAAPAAFTSLNNELLGAASSGDTAQVARLLGQGANIDAKNNQGDAPLLLAAKSGKADIVKLLIEKGADIEAKNNKGDTALIAACMVGHADVARVLVEKGASIDARDEGAATALMYAGLAGDTAIVDLLLAKGANIEAQDDNGETPLMYAASSGSVEAVKLMLRKNANPSVKDHNGKTALDYALQWKHPEAARLLGHGSR